jgi:hypothetical protein
VLKQLTILEPTANGPSPTDITGDLEECKTGVAAGGECRLVDESAPEDGGVPDGGLAKADPHMCLLGAADWCRCQGDPTASELGAWNCDPFSPGSVVIATFDRLLDTTPFEADGGTPADEIVALTSTPAATVEPIVDYSSTGSANFALVFNNFGPFFGNFRSFGPSIQVGGSPALPSGATIGIDLSKMNVRAKDGKTSFTGEGFLEDGSIKFKTTPFGVAFTSPVGDDLPTTPPASTDGGVADGGASDAGASDAAVADASADAPPAAPAPTTGPVPADMDMVAVTLTFTTLVAEDAQTHVTMTVDGQPFTAFTITSALQDMDGAPVYPTTGLVITPTGKWEPGKSYTVTVDANVADLTGVKLGKAKAHTFVMAN